MTGFYSIFCNHPAHFCGGLVVTVVMPQYSAVPALQSRFCSHAPSQKHRVTSLTCSGKGAPTGLFCSHLVFFSSFFLSVFPPLHHPQSFSQSICSGDLHLQLIEKRRRRRKKSSSRVSSAGNSGLVCGISLRSSLIVLQSRWMWLLEAKGVSVGITRHLAQRSCVTVTLLSGRSSEGHSRGSPLESNINFRERINRLWELWELHWFGLCGCDPGAFAVWISEDAHVIFNQ